jgi:hypothetical protein
MLRANWFSSFADSPMNRDRQHSILAQTRFGYIWNEQFERLGLGTKGACRRATFQRILLRCSRGFNVQEVMDCLETDHL